METSLDRKLARCAREIEEAKPKGLSFYEFENFDHGFNGAAQAEPARAETPRTPVAAPPSPKFKVGDRVRARMWGDGVVIALQPDTTDGHIYQCQMELGVTWFVAETIELIPPEPKAEGGWIEWKGGVPPRRGYMVVRWQDGEVSSPDTPDSWFESCWTHEHNDYCDHKIVAYRMAA